MLRGSPQCTAWPIFQNQNARIPEGSARSDVAKRKALVHLQVCAAMYRELMRGGRYFVHEHPKTADSWNNPHIKALRDDPRTTLAESDLRQFGLISKDKEGEGFAKKPTTFMTNSLEMAKTPRRKCPGDHRHCILEG